MKRTLLMVLAGLWFIVSAQAEDVITADRPSFSNSTVIVPPGSLQLETGVNRQKSQDPSGQQAWLTQTPILLRAGLWSPFEARLNWNGYEWQNAGSDHTEGAGDLSAGFKWRHREQSRAWPAIASVVLGTFPSGQASVRTLGFRPGWQLPFDWDLPGDNALTLMPATTYDTSEEGKRFWNGAFSVLLNHSWSARVQTFVEYAGQQFATPADGGVVETADIGASWAFLPDWVVDSAIYFGLNRNSPVQFFTIGLSTRRLGLLGSGN